jgi:hypothetical protein
MRRVAPWLCLVIPLFACGGRDAQPTSPSLVVSHDGSPSGTSAASARAITAGEPVEATLIGHGTAMAFDFTAPADGTLVVRVDWDPKRGRLELQLMDKIFANNPDNVSPVIGTLPIVAGQTYRVQVADGAPWDYDELSVPYVLKASLQ